VTTALCRSTYTFLCQLYISSVELLAPQHSSTPAYQYTASVLSRHKRVPYMHHSPATVQWYGLISWRSCRDKGCMEHGCDHYKRRCKLVAPCCGEVFWCRHCHNQVKDDSEQVALRMCWVCAFLRPYGECKRAVGKQQKMMRAMHVVHVACCARAGTVYVDAFCNSCTCVELSTD
jgi:hypothetical protein